MITLGLTPKQEKFVQGLFKGLSQRKAYIEAGYSTNMSEKKMDDKACEIASKGEVKGRLRELQGKVESDNIASEIEIAEFYSFQMRNEELEARDRRAAADSLAKTKGMFKDKVELQVKKNIEDVLKDD